MTKQESGWNTVFAILGTLFAGWLGYFVVLFVLMLSAVWFLVNVWPR